MGIFKKTKQFYKAYKLFSSGKPIGSVKAGLDSIDENRENGLELRRIRQEKKKIQERMEIEKEKLKGELELKRLQAQLDEVREELGEFDEEEEENINQNEISPKDAFTMNILNALMKNINQNPQTNKQNTESFNLYPTGTTDNQPAQINQPAQDIVSNRQFEDDDLRHYLEFLNPEQQNLLKQLPDSDILRAKQLLNE
jgi:uncharacterized protein (DUF3084 family)